MKIVLQTLFFFLLVTHICFGQWYQQNSGTKKNLHDVFFLDTNKGFAIGDSGLIIQTTNGGNTWIRQESGTTISLNSICFTDTNDGWIVGGDYTGYSGQSILIHTTDGGSNWHIELTNTNNLFNDICFPTENTGFIGGGSIPTGNVLLKTNDGGISWLESTMDSLWHFSIRRIFFIDSITGWSINTQGHVILRTTDGGLNWSLNLTLGGQEAGGIGAIHFLDSNYGIVAGGCSHGTCEAGNYAKTTDGGETWIKQTLKYTFKDVVLIDSNFGIALGRRGDTFGIISVILVTRDAGESWEEQFLYSPESLNRIYFIDETIGWIVGDNGTILHTTNGGNPVPVELTSFTATANGKEVTLSWSTATELNNQGFEVQRKFGENNFATIGSVKGHGTTTTPNNYTYVDKLTDAGKYFYRLKQIDFSGKYEYSQVVEVNWSPFNTYKLEQNYPNPFNPATNIRYAISNRQFVSLKLYDVLGDEIATLVNEEKEAGSNEVEFNAENLSSGVYFYQLKAGLFIDTKKMILVR